MYIIAYILPKNQWYQGNQGVLQNMGGSKFDWGGLGLPLGMNEKNSLFSSLILANPHDQNLSRK